MTNESNHDINGNWRGKYFYSGQSHANGFEAVFLEMNGVIDGNILDDGSLGEATVGGTFTYPSVQFTKVYRRAGAVPVNYSGTMSEDGKTILGRWIIPGTLTGTWIAMRNDDADPLKFEEWEKEQLEKARSGHAPSLAQSNG